MLFIIAVKVMFLLAAVCCACVVGLLFCDIRFSVFTGEAAQHIHDCQRKLEEMYQ